MRLAPWSIPSGGQWQKRAIRTIGSTASGSGFPPSLQGETGLELPFYKVKHLGHADKRGLLRAADDSISRDTAAKLGAKVFPAGTLVYAKVGAALMLGRVRTLPVSACLDNNMAGLTPGADVDVRFLFWAMSQVKFDYLVNPGAVPSLSDRNLLDYPLLLPPVEEQRAIADFLDRETARIDTLIEEQHRLIDLLRERRAAVAESEIAALPWTTPLRALTTLIQTGPFGSQLKSDEYLAGGTPVINPSHLVAGKIEPDDRVAVSASKSSELARHGLHEGDVIVARRGELGRCAVVRPSDAGFLCGTGSALIRPDTATVDPRFLALVFGGRRNRDELALASVGSTMDNLNADILAALRVPSPPLNEQRRIATYLEEQTSKIDTLIAESERFIELSRERRAALITAAVTGQIDVREEVAG